MKQVVISFTVVFLSLTTTAQKNFEGVIDFIMSAKDSPVLHIKVWFAYPKIKMETTVLKKLQGIDAKNETIILDFKKGTISRIKNEDKRTEVEKMAGPGKKQDIPPLKADSGLTQVIAGHRCTAFTTGDVVKTEGKDSVMADIKANITIWYAADLYFGIADQYKGVQMVPLLTNGRLGLGSSILVNAAGHELSLVTTTQKIDGRPLQKSVFNLPLGYKIQYNDRVR